MTIRLLRALIILFVIIVVLGYAIWRSENYVRGPEINIFVPVDNYATTTSTIVIEGQVERVNSLYLNGKSVSVDEQGNFKEEIIIFPGVNTITIEAHDRFQRITKKQLKIAGI
jgi:hypothetical protein